MFVFYLPACRQLFPDMVRYPYKKADDNMLNIKLKYSRILMTDLDLKIFFTLNANPASYRFGRLLQQAENQRNTKCPFALRFAVFYNAKGHLL